MVMSVEKAVTSEPYNGSAKIISNISSKQGKIIKYDFQQGCIKIWDFQHIG